MRDWFSIFRKKRIPEINRFCAVEIKSGYSFIGSGILAGKLTTFENKDYSVDLKEIHFRGLYLFDSHNQVNLVVTNNEESVSVSVKVQSYERNDFGFSVILRVCEKNIKSPDFERFISYIANQSGS